MREEAQETKEEGPSPRPFGHKGSQPRDNVQAGGLARWMGPTSEQDAQPVPKGDTHACVYEQSYLHTLGRPTCEARTRGKRAKLHAQRPARKKHGRRSSHMRDLPQATGFFPVQVRRAGIPSRTNQACERENCFLQGDSLFLFLFCLPYDFFGINSSRILQQLYIKFQHMENEENLST